MSALSLKLSTYVTLLKTKTPTNAELKDWFANLSVSAKALEERLDQLTESCEELSEENQSLAEKEKKSRVLYESCETMKAENVRLINRVSEVMNGYRSLERDLQKEREAFRDFRNSTDTKLDRISIELKEKDMVIETLREENLRGDEAINHFEAQCISLSAELKRSQVAQEVLREETKLEISSLQAKVEEEESVSDRLLQASLAADDDMDEVFVPACFRNLR